MNDNSKLKFTDCAEEENLRRYNPNAEFNKVYFEMPNEATDTLNLARTLFDLREYRKCAYLLKQFATPKH